MNCDEAAALIAAAADGEIDGLRGHALRKHLVECAVCTVRHQDLLALRQRLGTKLGYFDAPLALRSRVRDQVAASSRPARAPRLRKADRWGWFGGGAFAGALATALVWNFGAALIGMRGSEDVAAEVVALHTRATLGNHLVEMASSDRHLVRPWLSARLDYAIPVRDWAQAGFPLMGARIERLDRRPVATLVYRYREHVIDVFVRPLEAHRTVPNLRTVRGFNVVTANGSEMEWIATSDLSSDGLSAFVQGLARGAVSPPVD